jgi:threonine synthase
MYLSGYRCFACTKVQSAGFSGFGCPSCGGNLEVIYDYAAVATEIAKGFDNDKRAMFRYLPLLPLDAPATPFPLQVGGTPLCKATRLGEKVGLNKLYLKDDSRNPSASLKDRATAVALQRAIDSGASVICAASTGNAGSSLACLAAAHGLPTVVFVPETAPAEKLAQTLCYGARVLAVRGNYDDAYDLCLEACEEFGWYNRSTGHNPFTREGKKTCAFEIWEDLGQRVPDRVVVSAGDGNILSGIWKGWRDLQALGLIDHLPRIDCAQSTASAAINQTARRLRSNSEPVTDWTRVSVDEVKASTLADSISVNRPRDGLAAVQAIIQSGGEAVTVTDEAILAALSEMASLTGIYPEPAAAAPWAAVRQMARTQMIGPDELTVCIVSGSGLKDVAAVSKAANTALIIDPVIEAVKDALRL